MNARIEIPLAEGRSGTLVSDTLPTTSAAEPSRRFVWAAVFAPSPSVSDDVDRKQAKICAAFAFVSAAASTVACLASLFIPDRVVARAVLYGMAAAGTAHALAFVAAKSSRPVLGARVEVAALSLTSLLIAFLLPRQLLVPLSAAAWLCPAIIATGALLGARHVLVAGAFASAMSVVAIVHAMPFQPPTPEPVLLIGFVSAMTYALTRHRDAVEQLRRRVLEQRNTELEELRNSLEERVCIRTRELAENRAALQLAYENLQDNTNALVVAEKLAAVGRLTAGIAHEMASPLSAAMAAVEEMAALVDEYRRSIGDADVTPADHRAIAKELGESLELAQMATEKLARFVRGIRGHTRNTGPQARERFRARAVVEEAALLIAHAARAAGAELVLDVEQDAWLFGSQARLSQALVNLMGNAIDAVAEHGRGRVAVRIIRDDGGKVVIDVRDDGPGIRDTDLSRIFEPFFTTKPHGKGTGLGLAIVQEIARDDFGGVIDVRTGPGATTFSLILPSAAEN